MNSKLRIPLCWKVAFQYAFAGAQRGERTSMFIFDESTDTLLQRAEGLGIGLRQHVESGLITIRQIDPAELPPGEFVQLVCEAVHREHSKCIIIDSLNGYLNAMPDERFLLIQLHELLTYLGNQGVLTLLVVAQAGLMGAMQSPVDVSYLSDGVLLLRYFEAQGAVRQAISVMKNRTGRHERTIREFALTPQGVKVGAPLTDFHGVLTGVPVYTGVIQPPMKGQV